MLMMKTWVFFQERAEIGYSLLAVSAERHREFLLGLAGTGPFENGALTRGVGLCQRYLEARLSFRPEFPLQCDFHI